MDKRLGLIVLAVLCVRAQAESFVVTRFDDPLPDACQPADCSLREAATAASQNDPFAGTDRIQLAAGTYTLIRGELPLGSRTQVLEIVGAGSAQTHLVTDAALFDSVNSRSLLIRGLQFQSTAGIGFSVTGTTAPGHLVLDDVAIPLGGGAVGASGNDPVDVTLELRNSEIPDGVQCNIGNGTCLIVDSRFSSLYINPSIDPGPTLSMSGSTLDGALDPDDVLTGFVIHRAAGIDITNSTITRTKVGVHAAGTPPLSLRLDRVQYSENEVPFRFGNNADIEIIDSVFKNNPTRAIYAEGDSTWSISGSSFIGNRVDGNAGGAIVVEDDVIISIENSTFAGNSFSVDAAGDGARGAAIGYRNGTGARIDLRHVTIARPAIMPVGIEGTTIGGYGGTGQIILNIDNSILAGSCKFDAGALHHNGGNIESPADSCGFSESTNQVSVSAGNLALGALDDYGGHTPTYLPSDDSVAIDSAQAGACVDFDQRGYARPFGGACDVGAVEIGAGDVLFADGFE